MGAHVIGTETQAVVGVVDLGPAPRVGGVDFRTGAGSALAQLVGRPRSPVTLVRRLRVKAGFVNSDLQWNRAGAGVVVGHLLAQEALLLIAVSIAAALRVGEADIARAGVGPVGMHATVEQPCGEGDRATAPAVPGEYLGVSAPL